MVPPPPFPSTAMLVGILKKFRKAAVVFNNTGGGVKQGRA